MLRAIVRWSLASRLLVLALAAAICVFGVLQLRDAPVSVFPEFEAPHVEIQTEAVGLSAAEVERLVAVPLEELLTGTARLESIQSESVPGLSSIELVFEPGTSTNLARLLVQERLSSVFTLPNVTKPPVLLQPLSAANRVMIAGFRSDELSLIDLSVLARWIVTPKLLGVPGVANVAVWGQRDRQLQVQTDPELLRAHGISLDQVVSTTGDALWVSTLSFLNASVPGTGGWIDSPGQRLGIRHVLPISSPDDLADVAVDDSNLRLGDVATIVEGHPPIIGDAFTDRGPGLLLVIEKFPDANTLEVTRALETAFEELTPGLAGVEIDTTVYRTADYVESAIDNVLAATLAAVVLLALALGVLFRSWRVAVIGMIALVVSLVAAALVMLRAGATINIVVLVGLAGALTAVVDATIVEVGRLRDALRRRDADSDGRARAVALVDATAATRGAGLFTAVVLVVLVAPIFFLGGETASFYRPLGLSYAVAVGTSLLVSLTVTPVLSVLLLSGATPAGHATGARTRLRAAYDRTLTAAVDGRTSAVTSAVVIAVVGVGLPLLVAVSSADDPLTVPAFEERNLRIDLTAAPGVSPTEMTRLLRVAGDEIRAVPGVEGVAGQIGRAETGDQVVGTNFGQLWTTISADADYDRTLRRIDDVIGDQPGVEGRVRPYLAGSIADVARPDDTPIVVRIYGPELDVLASTAEDVRVALEPVEGLTDLRVDSERAEPQVEIEVDLAEAQRHGVKPGDVRRAAATIFAGIPVGALFEQQKVFEVSVWSQPDARGSIDRLEDVLVDTPEGGHVRVGDVADVRLVSIPTAIRHDAGQAYLDVRAGVSGRSVDAVAADVTRRLRGLDFPIEYHPKLLDGFADREAARRGGTQLWIAAAIAIVLILQLRFGSWRLAALAFVAMLGGAAGGVAVAVTTDGITSVAAVAGLLAVLALGTRSSILLIDGARAGSANGLAPGDAIRRAAHDRLVPASITAVAVALALAPLVVLGDIAGLEILRPMALVTLGGLVTTALVQLLVLPSLYRFVAPEAAPDDELDAPHPPRPELTTDRR